MIRMNLHPGRALQGIDDPVELADALQRAKRGCWFSAKFLRRFVYLMARDQSELLASERDALVNKMAALANCAPSCLRYDVERIVQERDRQVECEHLERLTGMTGPAELGDER